MSVSASQSPAATGRRVLEGVPRVGFYRSGVECPENMPFPSCLRACLEYLGEPPQRDPLEAHGREWLLSQDYAQHVATSGAGFRLNWKPGWHADNVALFHLSDDPAAPFRRAFAAAGYGLTVLQRDEPDGEARLRAAIVDNIDRGRPVIAHGVVGPPEDAIVCGYDEGGDVLIGWSFFQDEPLFAADTELEPNGYFRKRDWMKDTWSLLLIGDKGPEPRFREVLRDTLEWALRVVRTPLTYGDCCNGLAAYEAWAEHLLRDDDFPDDPPVLGDRLMVHDDAVGTVAEGRWYVGQFLHRAAKLAPDLAPHLVPAAHHYHAEHDLMYEVWGAVGGMGRDESKARALADPQARRVIRRIILEARDRDAAAADDLERALARI